MDTEEKLITTVQQYQCLYNVQSKYYSDKHAKNNAWEKVSAEMKISAADCQKKWKKIRDSYRKSLRLKQEKQDRSGSVRKNDRPIKFENELEFLKPYIQDRPQISNLNSPEESNIPTDSESNSEMPSVSSPRPSPQSSNYTSTSHNAQQPPKMSNMLYEQYLKSKETENDPTMSFFMTMGRTVKLMPHMIQAQIKGKIFHIINEAEIMLYSDAEAAPSPVDNIYANQTLPATAPQPPSTVDNIYANQTLPATAPQPPSTVDNIYANQTLPATAPPPPSTVDNIYANQTLPATAPPPPSTVDNIYANQTLPATAPPPPSTVDNIYANQKLPATAPPPPSTVYHLHLPLVLRHHLLEIITILMRL